MAVLAEGVKRALQSTGRRRLYTRPAGWDWVGVRFLLAEDGDPLQEQWARRDIFGFESQAAGLAVHIPSAKAGGLREQLDIVDFADRLRIGLETEPRIVEISECEPLPLGNRAGRRTRKRRRLRVAEPGTGFDRRTRGHAQRRRNSFRVPLHGGCSRVLNFGGMTSVSSAAIAQPCPPLDGTEPVPPGRRG